MRRLPAKATPHAVISPWGEHRQEETARLISAAYHGHIDSHINDQYRSVVGARRFLMNIVQYPGCGTFFAPASFAAASTQDHLLCGVSLASRVAGPPGPITQVCRAPQPQSTQLCYHTPPRPPVPLPS